MRYIFCLLLFGCMMSSINATAVSFSENELIASSDTLAPKVFKIGEYEAQYEKLMSEHEILLLSACNDDMNIAFEKWQGMLQAMEQHSDQVNYDLKGVKMWLNIFWEEDGSIRNIAYYLKPNSRNVDTDKLSLFFISFMNNYQFPLVVGERYSHYGIAAFPTFSYKQKKTEIDTKPLASEDKDRVNPKGNE